jgi:hypothetical protein
VDDFSDPGRRHMEVQRQPVDGEAQRLHEILSKVAFSIATASRASGPSP